MAADPEPIASLCEIPSPPRCGDDWTAFVQVLQHLRSGKLRLAGRD